MKFNVSQEDNNYVLDIKIPKGTVEKKMNDLAKSLQPRVRIKGYRDGKAPLSVIRTQMRDTILGEVSTRLLYSSVAEGLKEHNIKNASNPTLLEEFRPTSKKKYVGKFNMDGSFHFKVLVEAPPEIEVKDYKGVKVSVDAKDFDNWVKKEVRKQQMMFGEKEVVDRPAQLNDEVNVAFSGQVDGKPFISEEDFTFQIGEGMFVSGFEESFIGRKAEESFTVNVTFPENYGVPRLDGKEATFNATLHEVFETKPHPLNDDLAMMLSYESVEDMMNGYEETWKNEFEKPLRSQIFNSIMDRIIEQNPFDVPDSWINQEMNMTLQRIGMDKMPTDPGMVDSIKNISERSVRISYLLDKIYEVEPELHLTSDELEELAKSEGSPHNMTGLEWLDQMRQRGQYEAYVAHQEQQKVISFLIDSAEIENEE